jgi:hypothetical protein
MEYFGQLWHPPLKINTEPGGHERQSPKSSVYCPGALHRTQGDVACGDVSVYVSIGQPHGRHTVARTQWCLGHGPLLPPEEGQQRLCPARPWVSHAIGHAVHPLAAYSALNFPDGHAAQPAAVIKWPGTHTPDMVPH